MVRPLALVFLGAFALCACGSREPDGTAPSSNAFVPPVTRAPEPIPGQRQATPLSAYVGRYPRDAVDGVSFYDRTEGAAALVDDVAREDVRRLITGSGQVSTPIVRVGSRIAAHGCEPNNCAGRNWTVLIAADGNRDASTVCYHDAETMGQVSEWSTRAGTERRPGECPQG